MTIYDDPLGDGFRYVNHRGHDDSARMVTMLPVQILMTEGPDGNPRIRTDNGSTGFFAGREFRFFYEFNIASAQSAWVKAILPVDCVLRLENIEVDTGGVRYRSWRDATDVGPWVAPASPTGGYLSRNPWAQAASGYVQQTSAEVGGNGAATIVGATVSGIVRLLTAGATAQRTSVGFADQQERGVSAGTYYIQLENIAGSGAAEGVYTFVLEELE